MTTKEQEPDIEDLIQDATTIKQESNQLNQAHEFSELDYQSLQQQLVNWYDQHRRKLPWRGDPQPYITTAAHTKATKTSENTLDNFCHVKSEPSPEKTDELPAKTDGNDENTMPRTVTPYETWVSEIMLQQTRVDTVIDYFLRWISKFPTVQALSEASEDDVNALWAGLGYYRRARMLHAGAKFVVNEFHGQLPSTTSELSKIPGIGPYTAGAIASIAFNKQEPLVDGNVIRVMARLRAIGADPKHKPLIDYAWRSAKALVQHCERPGALNQALMELGATVCTVQNPQCASCPVKTKCLAYEEAQQKQRNACKVNDCKLCDASRQSEWNTTLEYEVTKYPLKAKKSNSKNEAIAVGVITQELADGWQYLMIKRPEGGLLAGQWEFLNVKVANDDKIPSYRHRKMQLTTALTQLMEEFEEDHVERRDLGELTHIFSHIKHHMGIEHVHVRPSTTVTLRQQNDKTMKWMTTAEMKQCGITTGVKKILQLVNKQQENPIKASRKPTRRTAANVTINAAKRMKTITSFFKK